MLKKIKGSFLALALGLAACNSNVMELKQNEHVDIVDSSKSLTTDKDVVDLTTKTKSKGFGIKATASLNGSIRAGEKVAYTFSGTAGQVLTLEMLGRFDTYLELRNGNANGSMLKEDDDSAGNLQSRISDYKLPYTGTYGIVARGYDSRAVGNYTLNFNLNDVAGPKTRWETVITQAESQAGAGLGNATSSIQQISGGYMRSYSGANGAGAGAIIYNTATDRAYWVHGGVYVKFIEKGGVNALGRPTSNEVVGLKSQISGHTSVYQPFDGNGSPSIQYDQTTGKAYLLLNGIRSYWLNNQSRLGQPTSDELQNPTRQNFEGGRVYWNNGNPSTNSGASFGDPISNMASRNIYSYGRFDADRRGLTTPLGYHTGTDFEASIYEAIYATFDGRVVISRTDSNGYGSVVVLEHTLADGSKVCTIYGHLSRSKGGLPAFHSNVKKGDIIGYIGTRKENMYSSTQSTNSGFYPHLHFGVKIGGAGSEDNGGTWYQGQTMMYPTNLQKVKTSYVDRYHDPNGVFIDPLEFLRTHR